MDRLDSFYYKLKAPTAARSSMIANVTWLLTNTQRFWTVFHVSWCFRKQASNQTDGWTDATKRIISPASRLITILVGCTPDLSGSGMHNRRDDWQLLVHIGKDLHAQTDWEDCLWGAPCQSNHTPPVEEIPCCAPKSYPSEARHMDGCLYETYALSATKSMKIFISRRFLSIAQHVL